MYSVMLAAMLTTTSATPEWGCHGCYGCSGSYGCNAFSCAGTCYGCGCHSYSCSGCSCYGCYGCSGCSGFFGSGSYLGGPSFDSFGCYGCHGGTYFSVFSCHGPYYVSCSGCSGCCGGCCGGVIVSPPVVTSGHPVHPAPPTAADPRTKALEEEVRALKEQNRELKELLQRMVPGKPGGGKPGGGKPGKPDETSEPAPAHVVVKLPDDARLFVDDQACPLTSATRSFDTPSLKPGQAYYYTLRAEVTRAGRPLTESKRVTLRAGEESVVEFGTLEFVQTAGR